MPGTASVHLLQQNGFSLGGGILFDFHSGVLYQIREGTHAVSIVFVEVELRGT